MQYWPEITETAKLLQAGAIGDILTARAKFWESAMGEWAVDYLPGSWRCDETKLPVSIQHQVVHVHVHVALLRFVLSITYMSMYM